MFGPNQNLQLAINDLTRELKNSSENITEEEFNMALHSELAEYYSAISMCVQERYTGDLLKSIIRTEYVSCHDLYRHAKSMQFSDLQNLCRRFFEQMKIVALIQGNLTEDAAKSIMLSVETNLGCGRIENVSCARTVEFRN